jgi:hypothetical protein
MFLNPLLMDTPIKNDFQARCEGILSLGRSPCHGGKYQAILNGSHEKRPPSEAAFCRAAAFVVSAF